MELFWDKGTNTKSIPIFSLDLKILILNFGVVY
jgi:hypothetical protein